MDIKNLLSFVQVAELNSFTKAAQVLNYSQSTISFQIKQLETELGFLLFERINHTLHLTDRGEELLAYAQQVCRLTAEFHQKQKEQREVEGYVHIVTPDSVCEAMLVENYADFFSRYPKINLKFSTADTNDMFRMLDQNTADVILTLDSHVYHKDYIIAKEARMSTSFVVGANSPLANFETIEVEDLLQFPMILTEKDMGYRRVLEKNLARRSIELQPVLEISRTDLIAKLLESGNAVSFLPDFVTQSKVDAGVLVRLHVSGITVDIWQQLIHHRNKWLSDALKAFLDYVKENEFNRA